MSVEEVSQAIWQFLDMSTIPEHVQESTENLLALRKHPNYFVAMLFLLARQNKPEEPLSFEDEMKILVEFKNGAAARKFDERDIFVLRQSSVMLLGMLCDAKTHMMWRQIAMVLTEELGEIWLDVVKLKQMLKQVSEDRNKMGWIISSLIGIPQACPRCHPSLHPHPPPALQIHTYSPILHQIILTQPNNDNNALYHTMAFIQAYLIRCTPLQAHQLIGNDVLALVVQTGIQVEGKMGVREGTGEGQGQGETGELEVFERILVEVYGMLSEWLSKEQGYNIEHCQRKYNFEPWHSDRMLHLLNHTLHLLQHNPTLPPTPTNTHKLKHLLKHIQTLSVPSVPSLSYLHPYIQPLLYEHIPNILYNQAHIILCEGVPLKYYKRGYCDQGVVFKRVLLGLWRVLAGVQLAGWNYRDGVQVRTRENQKWPRKIENRLDTFGLHFKFVFQKLTETLTFFSVSSKSLLTQKKQLKIQHKLWDLKDQTWITVIFQLFKQIYQQLYNPAHLPHKKTIPHLLTSYILPRLFSPNPLLQAHTISVLSVCHAELSGLTLTADWLKELKGMLDGQGKGEREGKGEGEGGEARDAVYRVLPVLMRNKQIAELVRANVNGIVGGFMELIEMEDADHELVKSLCIILKHHKTMLNTPETHINTLLQKFLTDPNIENPESLSMGNYLDCLQAFMELPIKFNHIRNNFMGFVRKSLECQEECQWYLEQMFRVIGDFFVRLPVVGRDKGQSEGEGEGLNEDLSLIFFGYCLSLSGCDERVWKMIEYRSNPELVTNFVKGCKPCPDESLTSMLWILQAFSIKPSFTIATQTLDARPCKLYLESLACILEKLKPRLNEQPLIFLEFQLQTLKGLVVAFEENWTRIDDQISTSIWGIGMEVWGNVEEEVRGIRGRMEVQAEEGQGKGKEKDKGQYMTDQDYDAECKEQLLQKIQKKLIELWSSLLWFNDQLTTQLIAPHKNFLEIYLNSINAIPLSLRHSSYNYNKRVIFGLANIVEKEEFGDEKRKAALEGLYRIYGYRERMEIGGGQGLWGELRGLGGDWEDEKEEEKDWENDSGWDSSDDEMPQISPQDDLPQFLEHDPYNLEQHLQEEGTLDCEDQNEQLFSMLTQLMDKSGPFVKANRKLLNKLIDLVDIFR